MMNLRSYTAIYIFKGRSRSNEWDWLSRNLAEISFLKGKRNDQIFAKKSILRRRYVQRTWLECQTTFNMHIPNLQWGHTWTYQEQRNFSHLSFNPSTTKVCLTAKLQLQRVWFHFTQRIPKRKSFGWNDL